nr:MAG: hypothetical protein 1 [Sobelivirales sp.]
MEFNVDSEGRLYFDCYVKNRYFRIFTTSYQFLTGKGLLQSNANPVSCLPQTQGLDETVTANPMRDAPAPNWAVKFVGVDGRVLGLGGRVGDGIVTATHVIQRLRAGHIKCVCRMDSKEGVPITISDFCSFKAAGNDAISICPTNSSLFARLGLRTATLAKPLVGAMSIYGIHDGFVVKSVGMLTRAKNLFDMHHNASSIPGWSGTLIVQAGCVVGVHRGTSHENPLLNLAASLTFLKPPMRVKLDEDSVTSSLDSNTDMYRRKYREDDFRADYDPREKYEDNRKDKGGSLYEYETSKFLRAHQRLGMELQEAIDYLWVVSDKDAELYVEDDNMGRYVQEVRTLRHGGASYRDVSEYLESLNSEWSESDESAIDEALLALREKSKLEAKMKTAKVKELREPQVNQAAKLAVSSQTVVDNAKYELFSMEAAFVRDLIELETEVHQQNLVCLSDDVSRLELEKKSTLVDQQITLLIAKLMDEKDPPTKAKMRDDISTLRKQRQTWYTEAHQSYDANKRKLGSLKSNRTAFMKAREAALLPLRQHLDKAKVHHNVVLGDHLRIMAETKAIDLEKAAQIKNLEKEIDEAETLFRNLMLDVTPADVDALPDGWEKQKLREIVNAAEMQQKRLKLEMHDVQHSEESLLADSDRPNKSLDETADPVVPARKRRARSVSPPAPVPVAVVEETIPAVKPLPPINVVSIEADLKNQLAQATANYQQLTKTLREQIKSIKEVTPKQCSPTIQPTPMPLSTNSVSDSTAGKSESASQGAASQPSTQLVPAEKPSTKHRKPKQSPNASQQKPGNSAQA